ncbi:MAG TPA: cytochrome c peroxidase, partial [Bryobacteraceae bacterium]|nr:cytochrome c peroxidase [Bryobacteraceae bacterium]
MSIRFSLTLLVSAVATLAQRAPQPIPPLKRVEIPKPTNLSTYVRDQNALVALGKALFWDLQVGSDGKVACATCHFHAGADHRLNNQLSNGRPGFPPNYRLTAADFPFHQLADPTNQSSRVIRDSTNRVGSAGMFSRKFDGVLPGLPADNGADIEDPTFRVGALNLRHAGDRNAPSVVNAVYYFRNFWDGRASETFTGATPFGLSDTRAIVLSSAGGNLKSEPLRLDKSSLASQ